MYRIGYYLPIIRLGKKSWFYPEGFYCDFLLPTIYSGATVPPKNVFFMPTKSRIPKNIILGASYWSREYLPALLSRKTHLSTQVTEEKKS